MRSDSILVVGSFVQDLTFSTQRFPSAGETVVGEFSTGPGGKGSNQAVAARRAGSNVIFAGAVGADSFARSVREFYGEEGIDARLAEYSETATGTAGILFDETGQNEIVVALGANAYLKPSDIPDAWFTESSIVVCQLECNLAAVESVLRRAGDHSLIRILNPAPFREECSPELLAETDILIPNETEFLGLLRQLGENFSDEKALLQMPVEEFDKHCRKLGPPTILVTLGDSGVHLSRPDHFERIPAVTGIQAVDTTGAGDAFVGAFAAGLQRFGGDLSKAAKFANRAAAISVTRRGTAPAMAHLEEIQAL